MVVIFRIKIKLFKKNKKVIKINKKYICGITFLGMMEMSIVILLNLKKGMMNVISQWTENLVNKKKENIIKLYLVTRLMLALLILRFVFMK